GGDFQAVPAGHPDVQQHQVVAERPQQQQRLLAVGGLADDLDLVELLQQVPQLRTGRGLVVDDQSAGAHTAQRSGIRRSTTVPRPAVDWMFRAYRSPNRVSRRCEMLRNPTPPSAPDSPVVIFASTLAG